MRKIAVSISKGGVGKTTTAVNVASGLALLDKKTLLIDLDPQGQVAPSLLEERPEIGLSEFILKKDYSLEDTLSVARENLWVLAGGRSITELNAEISRKDFGGQYILSKALKPHEEKFDYIIIDTPPSLSPVLVNMMFYVDEILVPASLEALTLESLVEFNQTLTEIQEYSSNVQIKYLVPTKFDRRTRQSFEILEQLKEFYGKIVTDPIDLSVRLSEAPGHHETIWEYAEGSSGAKAYAKLIERILEDE